MATKIQVRRGISASWSTANPILSSGEIGFETDSYKFKIGDGSSNWSELDYFTNEDFIVSASANAFASASAYTNLKISELTTENVEENTNLYFTEERSLNTASTALVHNNHTNLTAVFVDNEIRFTGSVGGGSGSVDLSGNVEIGLDLTVGEDLAVAGSGSVVGNFETIGNISAGSNVYIQNNLEVNNDVNIQGDLSADNINVLGKLVSYINISTPTLTSNSYTLVSSDESSLILMDNGSTANTLLVPTDATYDFPIGTQITVTQSNTGQTTISAATPATTTINYTPGNKLRARWSSANLIKTGVNTWLLIGDLTL